MQNLLDKISANKNFEVVAEAECLGQLEVSMPAMENFIQTHPEINIVVALNDPSAMGAIAALQNKNLLDDIKVYGGDGEPVKKIIELPTKLLSAENISDTDIDRRD